MPGAPIERGPPHALVWHAGGSPGELPGRDESRGSASVTTSLFACAACGADVPPGRLACPACGELLASVGGSPVRAVHRGTMAAPEETSVLEPEAPNGGPEPPAAAHEPAIGQARGPQPEPATISWPQPEPVATRGPERAPERRPTWGGTVARPAAPVAADVPPGSIAGPPISPTDAFAPGALFAGAMSADPVDPLGPAPAPAGARSSGLPAWKRPPLPRTPVSIELPVLDQELGERLVAGAAGLTAAAFLLPWGVIVVGAPSWGAPWMAIGALGSSNWLALLALLGAVALALRGQRVADWIRLGVIPFGLGSLVLGIAWPYVLGPIGSGIGPLVLLAGALALVGLGLLGVRPARHPADDATV